MVTGSSAPEGAAGEDFPYAAPKANLRPGRLRRSSKSGMIQSGAERPPKAHCMDVRRGGTREGGTPTRAKSGYPLPAKEGGGAAPCRRG